MPQPQAPTFDDYLLQLHTRNPLPWTHRTVRGPRGGLVQVLDANGVEVEIHTFCGLLQHITPSFKRRVDAYRTDLATAAAREIPGEPS